MEEILVDIPGVGEVAFPATMSREQINKAVNDLVKKQGGTSLRQPRDTTKKPSDPIATFMDRLLTGSGKRGSEIGMAAEGVGMRIGDFLGMIDPEQRAQYEERIQSRRSVMSPEYRSTVPSNLGEFIGSAGMDIAGGGALGMGLRGLGAGARALTGSSAAGAVPEYLAQSVMAPRSIPQAMTGGAMYSQTIPYGSTEEALAGAGIGSTVGAVTQPFMRAAGLAGAQPSALPEAQQAAARRSIEEGFQFTPSQMTGRGQIFEEGLKALPFARGSFERLGEQNQEVVQRVAKQAIGIPESAPLTVEAIENATKDALQSYKALENIPNLTLDQQFISRVDDLIAEMSAGVAEQQTKTGAKEAIKVLEGYKKYATDALEGKDVRANLNALTNRYFNASKNKKVSAPVFKQLREEFEDAVDRALTSSRAVNPDLIQQYRDARSQLSNIFTVENAFNPATGEVSGRQLARDLSRRSGYTTRETPLETAGMASTVFPSIIGSSGTAERAEAADALKSLIAGGAAGAMTGDMGTAATAAIGTAAIPFLAGRAYTSKPVADIIARRSLGATAPDEGLLARATRGIETTLPEGVRGGLGNVPRYLLDQYLTRGLLGY